MTPMLLSIHDPAVQKVLNSACRKGGTLFPSPADWRDTWIYFVMLDRFSNPDRPPRHQPYDAVFNGFQGGTFQGVQQRLPYLKKLGVRALWLSPVLKNAPSDGQSYHGYGIQNFLEIEPRLASNPERAAEELEELIQAAHALDIYVIVDIVPHHGGNVFAYAMEDGEKDELDWQEAVTPIRWRDEVGEAREDWAEGPIDPHPDAALWPVELQRNALFTRQGSSQSDAHGFHPGGDFSSLKAFSFEHREAEAYPVRDILIRAHEYLIARFDIDGFRLDTLKFLPADFAREFGKAMHHFAARTGKKNFFLFGEIYDSEETISQFIGRDPANKKAGFGVDAAMDYPLFFKLPPALKGLPDAAPADVAAVFQHRQEIEADILQGHGAAGEYFVTFLDNQDQNERFGFGRTPAQVAAALGVLFTLQGVPCVYYGTELGLTGHKTPKHEDDSLVREALWGKPGAFGTRGKLFRTVSALAALRAECTPLRLGSQFFRPVSGDGHSFDLSRTPGGVLAYSRLWKGEEVLVVANMGRRTFTGEVLVDFVANRAGADWQVVWSSRSRPLSPGSVLDKPAGSITLCEENGATTSGPARTLPVTVRPGEVQVLRAK